MILRRLIALLLVAAHIGTPLRVDAPPTAAELADRLAEAHAGAPSRRGARTTTTAPRPPTVASTTTLPQRRRQAGPPGTAAPAPATPAGDAWAALRQCESHGDYTANTGNGFYGAYQFDARTWAGVTRTLDAGEQVGRRWVPTWPRADLAPPDAQDRAAASLQAAAGWQKWPACSRALGLR